MMKLRNDQIARIRDCALTGARHLRASGGKVPPMMLLFNSTPAGELGDLNIVLMMGSKADIAREHIKMVRSPDIAAAALICEAWAVNLAPGESLPDSVAARPDRAEVLMVSLLDAADQWMLQAPIRGAVIADADFEHVDAGNYRGRYVRGADHAQA